MLRLYVICVALVVSACSDNEVEQLAKIRDEVCACTTPKCAETALERVPKRTVEPSPRAQRVARDMLDCVARLYEEGRPTQDPDAPVEATDPEMSGSASAGTP